MKHYGEKDIMFISPEHLNLIIHSHVATVDKVSLDGTIHNGAIERFGQGGYAMDESEGLAPLLGIVLV